jgi:thiamine pyrophosphokinase
MNKSVVILANGSFPDHDIPLGYLKAADKVICCDGAVVKLVESGIEPWAVVGDLDSVPDKLARQYADRMHSSGDQDTNDLTKAVIFALENGFTDIVILAATGGREDHTIGNISLLVDYSVSAEVKMVTDNGIFLPVRSGTVISSWAGQQVSVFSTDPLIEVSSTGLKYPLEALRLANWWTGTLNESTGESFSLEFSGEAGLLVYLVF